MTVKSYRSQSNYEIVLSLDLYDIRSPFVFGAILAHNWAVHMHSPNVVPRTEFEGHTTSGVNNL